MIYFKIADLNVINGCNQKYTLRKKCPYSELFWSAFSSIRTKYGEIRSIFTYSVQRRENVDKNNSEYGHFSRSDRYVALAWYTIPMVSMFAYCYSETRFKAHRKNFKRVFVTSFNHLGLIFHVFNLWKSLQKFYHTSYEHVSLRLFESLWYLMLDSWLLMKNMFFVYINEKWKRYVLTKQII